MYVTGGLLRMQFYMLASTYRPFGAHPVLGELSNRMARAFGEVEFGLSDVGIVVCKDIGEPADPMWKNQRAKFNQSIAELPKVRFESKRRQLRISYTSSLDVGWDLRSLSRRPSPTEELLCQLFQEFLAVLEGFRPKLKKKPALQFDAFADALRARQSIILHSGPQGAAEPDRERPADPGEDWSVRFKIDWSQYHPKARRLLDEPFYWDPANDDSPHGANSGAHLLHDFRRWRQRHPQSPPWDYFLDRRFRQSGMLGRLNQFRETRPADYVERDGVIARQHDGDLIALAFALLKIDGACDPKIRNEALIALRRKRDIEMTDRLGWTVTARERELAARLEAKLLACV